MIPNHPAGPRADRREQPGPGKEESIAFIETIDGDEATGTVAETYQEMRKRAAPLDYRMISTT